MHVFVPFALIASAYADDVVADPLAGFAETLIAAPDHAARVALLTEKLGTLSDADDLTRTSVALAVVRELDAQGRTDKTITRWFVEAALSLDPATREAALEAAKAGGDPPMDAPVTKPVLQIVRPDGFDVDLLDYQRRALHRDSLTTIAIGGTWNYGVWGSTTHTWGAYDGGGAPLNTKQFATLVGDDATLEKLAIGRKRTTAAAIGLGLGGAIATGLGFYFLDQSFNAIDDFRPYGGYQAASLTCVILGGTGLGLAIAVPMVRAQKVQFVSRHYTTEQADHWIDEYNADLREELGVTEE